MYYLLPLKNRFAENICFFQCRKDIGGCFPKRKRPGVSTPFLRIKRLYRKEKLRLERNVNYKRKKDIRSLFFQRMNS